MIDGSYEKGYVTLASKAVVFVDDRKILVFLAPADFQVATKWIYGIFQQISTTLHRVLYTTWAVYNKQ